MSADIDRIKNDQNLPITYSINIQTSSTPRRPLTCYIATRPRTSNQSNYFKPPICLEKKARSAVHLPVTYSTSIQVPCRPPIILPSPQHHYHHYHHHYYYHHHHHQQQRQSLSRSTTIKRKISPPPPTSIASTQPTTTSSTTAITSPESSSLPSKKPIKNIASSKQSTQHPPPPPLPSYSTLVWNWFHHTPTKPSPPHKGSQSDYSETYRHELPSKRSLLFKLLTSPIEKSSKTKHQRPCFTRKRLESSSSLPNKSHHYHE